MTKTLDEVRQKFPNCNYAPRERCKYCGGTGERTNRPGYPCICIYVAHDILAAIVKKIREEVGLTKDFPHAD